MVVVLGFYVNEDGILFLVSSERLKKPEIELRTPDLQGKYLFYCTTEAATKMKRVFDHDISREKYSAQSTLCSAIFLENHIHFHTDISLEEIRGLLFKFIDFPHCSFDTAFIQN